MTEVMTLQEGLDHHLLSLVASKTDNAVVITDRRGVIEWVNEGFTRITEFTLEEAIGKTPGRLLQGPDTDPAHVQAIRDQLKTGKSFVQEILNYTKSGKAYWLRLSITPIRNDFDEITNYIAIESDITEEKRSKEEVEKALKKSQEAEEKLKGALAQQEELSRDLMLAELKFKSTFKQEKNIAESLEKYRSDLQNTQDQLISKEKMASIGLLTAGIAHEINNPMNFISSGVVSLKALMLDFKAYLDELESEILNNLPAKTKKQIDSIKEEYELDYILEDMQQMISDVETGSKRTIEIIDSLRVSARGDEKKKIKTSINGLIDASLILLKNKIVNGLVVDKKYGDLKEVACFPGPLNQVFTNIINNAIQAIPKGKKGLIEIVTEEDQDFQYISIKDNGSGIPAAYHDKIFEASFTTKDVGEGTGLGMSISKEIIEKKHKGKLTFETQESKGTCFRISIPLKGN